MNQIHQLASVQVSNLRRYETEPVWILYGACRLFIFCISTPGVIDNQESTLVLLQIHQMDVARRPSARRAHRCVQLAMAGDSVTQSFPAKQATLASQEVSLATKDLSAI